ncbi:hypothetical protein DVDV_4313 [Desulfovibrio sp. DV]|nr:hypothetical protein DVDV_4313 [Desulfovibrio sp. DV]
MQCPARTHPGTAVMVGLAFFGKTLKSARCRFKDNFITV